MSMPQTKRESLLLNLGLSIVIPVLILSKLSDQLGAKQALLLALAFPLGYGIYDALRRRKFNFVAALGFFSTLATGGFSLMRLEPFWFAVKEATVPALIGLMVILSQWTKRPLVRTFLLNDEVLNLPRVNTALDERGTRPAFDRLLGSSSWLLAASFALSSVLNFALARYLITEMPETPAFNAQYGKMMAWSWPVIVVPSMGVMIFILWRLIKGLRAITGLKLEEIMHVQVETKPAPQKESPPDGRA
ncbi:MAG: VC0807 family protein [Candidatus Didemnitutus sp.]|nr:VC0807 family protein [Candidatus Didemnitutus sp.]